MEYLDEELEFEEFPTKDEVKGTFNRKRRNRRIGEYRLKRMFTRGRYAFPCGCDIIYDDDFGKDCDYDFSYMNKEGENHKKYFKRVYRTQSSKYIKKHCNRALRRRFNRYGEEDTFSKSSYHKYTEFWWELY